MATSRRLIKGGKSCIVEIPNFADEIAEMDIVRRSILRVGNHEWVFEVSGYFMHGVEYLRLIIRCSPNETNNIVGMNTAYGISLINEDPNSWVTYQSTSPDLIPDGCYGGWGFKEMDTLLDPESGFLTDGALRVQVEIRVDVITDKEGVRQFNVYDPFEGCVKFKMGNSQKVFYASKQLIMHHSSVLAERIAAGEEEFVMDDCSSSAIEAFELYLQLGHGVNDVKVPEKHAGNVLQYAIQFDTYPTRFRNAEFKRVLKMVKSLEELKEVLEVHERYVSDTETMKTVAREIFSFAVDFRWGPKKGV